MSINLLKVAGDFSSGNFTETYEFMADSVKWDVKGNLPLIGKKAVIEQCEKMKPEMAGSKPNRIREIIDAENIVVFGYYSYTNEDGTPGRVDFCDLFLFKNDKLQEITSFIAEAKLS